MADFKSHVTCSSATGAVLGGAAYLCGVPPATCLVAAGLCGLAGMLPDVDSNSSRSFKTCLHIAAVLGAMITIQWGRMFRIDHDWVLFAASCVFFFILYTVGAMIRRLTAHRGMIHSIPAAVIAGQFLYLVSEGDTMTRFVKALALTAGFISHLILDEVYSVDSTGKAFRIKKSFGTALKMIDYKHKHITATFYAVALLLGSMIANESTLGIRSLVAERSPMETTARPTPLKDWLTSLPRSEAKPTESPEAVVSVDAVSVDLRPTVRAGSRYAENELFRRSGRRERPEFSVPEDSVVSLSPPPLPERPTIYRRLASRSDEAPPLRLGSDIPLPRNRVPAAIALE